KPRPEAGGDARGAGRTSGGDLAKCSREEQPQGGEANVRSDAGALDPVHRSGGERSRKFTDGNASGRTRRTGNVATSESSEAADLARQGAAANAGCEGGDLAEFKDECHANDVSGRTRGASEPPAACRNSRTRHIRMGRCGGGSCETGSG